jgi:hypothetical protein
VHNNDWRFFVADGVEQPVLQRAPMVAAFSVAAEHPTFPSGQEQEFDTFVVPVLAVTACGEVSWRWISSIVLTVMPFFQSPPTSSLDASGGYQRVGYGDSIERNVYCKFAARSY